LISLEIILILATFVFKVCKSFRVLYALTAKIKKPIAMTNAGIKVSDCSFLKIVFESIIEPLKK